MKKVKMRAENFAIRSRVQMRDETVVKEES